MLACLQCMCVCISVVWSLSFLRWGGENVVYDMTIRCNFFHFLCFIIIIEHACYWICDFLLTVYCNVAWYRAQVMTALKCGRLRRGIMCAYMDAR